MSYIDADNEEGMKKSIIEPKPNFFGTHSFLKDKIWFLLLYN